MSSSSPFASRRGEMRLFRTADNARSVKTHAVGAASPPAGDSARGMAPSGAGAPPRVDSGATGHAMTFDTLASAVASSGNETPPAGRLAQGAASPAEVHQVGNSGGGGTAAARAAPPPAGASGANKFAKTAAPEAGAEAAPAEGPPPAGCCEVAGAHGGGAAAPPRLSPPC